MKLNNLRKNKIFSTLAAISLFCLQTNLSYAQVIASDALPVNLRCTAGSCAGFDVSTVGSNMSIHTSGVGVAQADSHNIGSNANVRYYLNGAWLTKVTGDVNPTVIAGGLHVEGGQLFLSNTNGVLFTGSSHVDASGLVASSLNIKNDDFLAGHYNFFQDGKAAYVVNEGQINVTNGGYVALLSNAVSNIGTIVANLGKVILAAGEKMTVALDDANDIAVTIDEAVKHEVIGPNGQKMKYAVNNGNGEQGTISANGGKIILTAKVLNNIFDYAVNNSGVIEAKSLVNNKGVVELVADGGSVVLKKGSLTSAKALDDTAQGGRVTLNSTKNTVVMSGATIDVSGGLLGGDAGFIELSAKGQLGLHSTQIYTNAAASSKRGLIIIDPQDIIIASSGPDVPTGDNATATPDEAYTDDAGLNLTIDPATLAALSSSEVYLQATRDIYINSALTLNTDLKLEAGNNINVNANITTNATGVANGRNITLTADADNAGGGALNINGVIVSNAGTVTGGTVTLNSATGITLSKSLRAPNGTVIINLKSGGVTQTGSGILAANLLLMSAGVGDFVLDYFNSLGNGIGNLAVSIKGALNFRSSGAMSVGSVGGVNGINTSGNNVTLTSGGTAGLLTLTKDINAGAGTVTFNPGGTGGVTQTGGGIIAANLLFKGTGTFTLASATNDVDVLAANITGGGITFTDMDDLTIGTVGASGGISLNSSVLTLNTGGLLTLANNISVPAGSIIKFNSAGGINQTTGKVSGGSLLLTGSGVFSLNNVNNDMATIAVNTTGGAVSYTDKNALSVGTVSGTSGITSGNNNITLNTGALSVSQGIDGGTGTVSITAAGISQSGSGSIKGDSLALSGTGAFTLTNLSNDVNTIAANVNGVLTFSDSDDLTVGTVGAINGITTTNNNATINSATALTLSNNINVGSGNLTLNSSSAGISQNAGAITANGLLLLGSGVGSAFTLNSATNDVATLAANTKGSVSYTDVNGLDLGTVGSTSGVSTLNHDVTLATGALSISQALNAGSGTVSLTASGVTQTAALTADKLGLSGTGAFTLTNASNDVGTIAANVNGVLSYKDANALTIGSVGAINGITTANHNVNLTMDDLDLAAVVNAGSANISIAQLTNGRAIDLGTNTSGKLSLTDAEFDNMTAGQLIIGNSSTGTITLSDNINPANINNVTLTSAAAVEGTAAKALTAATLTVNAATGIGATNALNTVSTNLNLASTNGNVQANNTNASATTVSNLSTGTGNITLTQAGGGDLTVSSATTTVGNVNLSNTAANLYADVVSAGGVGKNVALTTTTSGDIALNNISAAGTITVTSAGAIEELGADVGADLTAGSLSLSAVNGIGTLGSIETAATTISADTTNNNIDLANSSAIATTASSLTTGTGNITFSQIGGGALTLSNLQTGDGDVNVDVTSANLTATAVNAGGANRNLTLTTHTSGNINVVNLTANGTATLNAAGSIVDDSTQASKISANTVSLTAGGSIGSSVTNGDVDLAAAYVSATSGGDIYLNELDDIELTSMSATSGLASVITGGDTTIKSVTTNGDFTLRATVGDVTFDGAAQSNAGAVNVQVDNGSILAKGNGTHLVAHADSLLSTPNGTIGVIGHDLNVDVTGNLILDIGGSGLTSARVDGTVNSTAAIPLLVPSNLTPPIRPAGNVYFNGASIFPSVSTFTLSQASSALINRFSFPTADQVQGAQVVAFDPIQAGPVFLYHPLTELDSGAFDKEFQLEEGAYDYIDGRIEQKKKAAATPGA